ncbi:MAG: hypothetical protein HY321_19275 [Armatimonadetes bacterium]|nr:hypothetical protein [Armatimonadota bacterium]
MESVYPHYCRLREEMERWLAQSIRLDPPAQGGGEDEANYALAWFPHRLVTGSEKVRGHLEGLLGLLAEWVRRDGVHGYEPEAEAHHGTEPFLLFLPRYTGLFPEDAAAGRLLDDAAHHIGNWVAGIPPWYDWERGRFRSYRLGTGFVKEGPWEPVQLAEHFRFLHIALAAWRVTGDARYREWAEHYGSRRARLLDEAPPGPLPIVWDPDGRPVWAGECPEEWLRMAGAGHHAPGDPLGGVEVLLASGAIYALGDLFRLTGEDLYRRAARRIAAPLVSQLADPYADPGAAAVAYYRWACRDGSFDADLRAAVDACPPADEGELALTAPERIRRVHPGVGRRQDMLFWGYWGGEEGMVRPTREPSTAALSLAYQLTGRAEYARRALRTAAARLALARRVLRGGREHSDMGGAVCSVAQGHGRNWGIGAVTGCYGPLCLGTHEVLGAVTASLEVRTPDGQRAIPPEVLSLVARPEPETMVVRLYNAGETPVSLEVRAAGAAEWAGVTLAAGESRMLATQPPGPHRR